MRKSWFMVMWVALLVGQMPLAGSVVICTTGDGHAHIERPDHHGHGHLTDHDDDHDPPLCHADECQGHVMPSACCRDITLDHVSPSLVHAKRVGYDVDAISTLTKAGCSVELNIDIPSISHHHPFVAGPDILRSVILLI